jgi:hypothetical protein
MAKQIKKDNKDDKKIEAIEEVNLDSLVLDEDIDSEDDFENTEI